MSIPRSLGLPPGVDRAIIQTMRGPFAALVAEGRARPSDATAEPGAAEFQATGSPPKDHREVTTADSAVGAGEAVAILVPGYTGSKEDFLAILAPIAQAGTTAVAIDLRGQFETDGSDDESAYELAELAADVLAVVEALGGHAHLVGHSFGGFVTRLATATSTPATVRSVTLMSSGPGRVTGPDTLANLGMLAGALPVYDMETIWGAKRAIELDRGDPVQPGDIEEFLHSRFVRTHPVSLSVAAAQLQAADDRVGHLEGLETPVLVLYGAGEDVWAPAELSAMAARIGARDHVIPGAGHSPAVDDPTATAAALHDFWATID